MFKDSVYSQFIYKSRYARWVDKEKRREEWSETVNRYLDFVGGYLLEEHKYDLGDDLRKEIYDAIYNHDVMPSMRALMTAGKAAERNHVALYNCLGGETLVTTLEYGISPIKNLIGKKVHIVDGNGEWTLSECKSYGQADLYNINLATSGTGKLSFRATANHRWIDIDGNDVLTSELKNGTRLANVSMPDRLFINENDDYRRGIIHGLVYGDGTATFKYSKGSSSKDVYCDRVCDAFVIRLCGTSRELIKYFEGYQKSYPKSYNGDPVIRIHNPVIDLKSLPTKEEGFNDAYLLGFIRGWLAADGSVCSTNKQTTLACIDEGKEWIYKYGPRYGFVPMNYYRFPDETNYGKRKADLFRIEFDRKWLKEEDFILQYKRDRFSTHNKRNGKVISVEFSGFEEVYCFEVPTTHSFLLTRNILTRNCSYLPIDDFKSFDETVAISMSGTGVGFSVENRYVKQLPEMPDEFFNSDTVVVFDDSRLGWAKGYRELISLLLIGQVPKWDVSKLRPAGAQLKTMGGRSSGPEPLVKLLEFTIRMFKNAAGRRLNTLEAHDLECMIGDIVVVGGVRRSAFISLSDLLDDRMRGAKSGNWYDIHGHRRLANNSAVYEERPDIGVFMREWLALYDSKSGERGILSRPAIKNVIDNANKFRLNHWKTLTGGVDSEMRYREKDAEFGTNPCSEIILRPYEFCNLSEVVVYEDDTPETLKRKVRIASIIGTFQSCFTKFKYINKKWQKNCENERLLGVSLTGILDNKFTNGSFWKLRTEFATFLEDLKSETIKTNIEFAKFLGINSSVAITCVKPSGTSSALNGTSSGIHPAHSPYYIRYVRNDLKDPLTGFMIDSGFPFEKDVYDPSNVVCFKFPIKSSADAVFKKDLTAIEHLELWKTYQIHWCEHKPSITVSVKENEWLEVGAWVYENFEWVSGVSFLPAEEGTSVYRQAPFTECDEKTYEELLAKTPKFVDWKKLKEYEEDDQTTNAQTLACTGGGCEII